jgi:hypothetical protein
MSIVVAALLLVMALTSNLSAGTEERCAGLGSQCLCAEGLNTATHDGGSSDWSTAGGARYNPDDSPANKQCYPPNTLSGPEFYCISTLLAPISANSGQGAFLPPGNSLSFVLKHVGAGVCNLDHMVVREPAPATTGGATHCLRYYRRIDPAWHVPVDANEQQKVLTIGGFVPPGGFPPGPGQGGFLTAQISTDVGGTIDTRFDGNLFNSSGGVSGAHLGNMVTDCTNNYCRFEVCLDYSASGEGRVRQRQTKVAPGSGQFEYRFPAGDVAQPQGLDLSAGGGGLGWFGQINEPVGSQAYIDFATHFIHTRVSPEDRTFWPGAACEVEGGCGGVIPQVPGTPILNVTWAW